MSLSNVFNIAGSAMSAQSIRLNTVSSNMANAESVGSSEGETYKALKPVFQVNAPTPSQVRQGDPAMMAGQGVSVTEIVKSEAPLRMVYEPNHPMANDDGYIFYPNVNIVEEMADMISASRSFQINTEIMNTAKQMLQKTLTLGN
jgi:flagellar basal-body rod protein FlgC